MKRIIVCFLCLTMLISHSGCRSVENGNTISFYYCRTPEQYRYFDEDGVICFETREILSHRNDLKYVLSLYLAGPLSEGLMIPFNKSTRLLSLTQKSDELIVELSDHTSSMTDAEYSLSCAALTLTCAEISSCQQFTINSGTRSVTMDPDSIILFDMLHQQKNIGG